MIHILQLTDTHLFADPEGSLYNINTRNTLYKVIKHVEKTHEHIDAVLLTGDLVHDESHVGYTALKTLLDTLDSPKYYLPGNHDDSTVMNQLLDNCINDKLMSFEAGNWSIVLLDSSMPGKVEGALSAETLEGLEKYLSDTTGKHILIALHHHIIDVKSPWLDALNLRNHEQLTGLLERFPAVKLVINGHVHQEIDEQRNGIRYLGTPATCFQFAVNSESGGIDGRPPAYRHIELQDDGTIGTTVHYVE